MASKTGPKIIGLVGSARKNGNSEILVKQVLRCCRQQGADVAVCRLSDLTVQPCRGCYRCARGKCPLNDSMAFFLDLLIESDGVVLGFPTYVHSIPGAMKMIQDRAYMTGMARAQALHGKKGLVINVGTNRPGFALPMGELFMKSFHVEVVASLGYVNCSLPGASIIKNHGVLETLERHAAGLMAAVGDPDAGNPDASCPFCRRRIVTLLQDNRVQCPVCKRKGRIVDGHVHWEDQRYFFERNFLQNYYRSLVDSEERELINNRPRYFELLSSYKDKSIKIPWRCEDDAPDTVSAENRIVF